MKFFGFLNSILRRFGRASVCAAEPSKQAVFSAVQNLSSKDKSEFGLFFDLPLCLSGILSTNGFLEEINSPWEKLTSRSRRELTSLSLHRLIHPKDRKRFEDIVHRLSKEPLSVTFEARILCVDKPPQWLLWKALSNPVERKIYLVAMPTSELKSEMEKINNSEVMFHEIFNTAPDMLVLMDRTGFIYNVNPIAEKVTGYTKDEIVGKHFAAQPFVPVSAARVGAGQFASLITGGAENPPFEFEIVTKDARHLIIEAHARTVRRNGKLVGVLAVIRDITERKKMEAELERARDAALESAKIKSEFLANMSHEIRTPMNAIVGMAELLKDSTLAKDQRHFVDTIVKSGESLLQIINDILDFSKMEAGKLEYREEEFNLREVAEESVELLAGRAFEKKLELGLFIPHGIQENIVGDPIRLKQVMVNLITNATRFTPDGDVLLKIKEIENTETVVKLRFEVSDTGIGISEKDKKRLFQSFSQVDSSATRKFGGTGLGLAISKRIVEGVGGQIGVESEKGKGSTFWFEVPFKKGKRSKANQAAHPDSFRGLRMLLIDDNKATQEILCHQLTNWGINPFAVESGYSGLESMEKALEEQKPYDLVLLDMVMPRLNGLDVARRIRENPAFADTKVILLSSLANPVKQELLSEVGIDAQLTKPISQSLLFDTIATVLRGAILPETTGTTRDEPPELVRKSHSRILIVEDNPVNQELTTLQLRKLGFEPDVSANGLEALEAVDNQTYSLIFMDCQMPEMDGFTATKEIRKRERNVKHVPIIGLTANAMEGDRKKCLSAGMDDYLSKPVKIEKLTKMIQKWDIPIDPTSLANVKASVGNENYPHLVEIYIRNSDSLIQNLKNHFETKNISEFSRAAHTLKGSSANMGARSLQILSGDLERLVREGKMDDIPSKLEDLEKESRRVFETFSNGFNGPI